MRTRPPLPNNRRTAGGFTLIEVLVALVLLTIVLAIIYGSYSSVVLSAERARTAAEKMKTLDYIVRSLTLNLAQATEGWSPGSAARAYTAGATTGAATGTATGAATGAASGTAAGAAQTPADQDQMRYPFLVASESSPGISLASITFASTAPMLGMTLPGQVKLCSYHIETLESMMESGLVTPPPSQTLTNGPLPMMLVLTETPWINNSTGTGTTQSFTGPKQAAELMAQAAEVAGLKSVSWALPVYAWQVACFDGTVWQPTWDSQQTGRLPWTVRIRLQLEAPNGSVAASADDLDPLKDPSVIELLFTVPIGSGIVDAPPAYVRPAQPQTQPQAGA